MTEQILTEADMLSRLLYRDGLILIIDKPAEMPVHAGFGGGTNMTQFLHHLRFGLPRDPGLAHRLDKDTSGCLVLGRNAHALTTLGKMFAKPGVIEKTYWALVHGAPTDENGIIDAPIKKQTERKTSWRMMIADDGQPSVTHYRILKTIGEQSLLELSPKTGRTHQLRLHCAHIGCPIVGDHYYGNAADKPPILLHAKRIVIPFHKNKPPIIADAPAPIWVTPAWNAM